MKDARRVIPHSRWENDREKLDLEFHATSDQTSDRKPTINRDEAAQK
jgi:hypothetical protein